MLKIVKIWMDFWKISGSPAIICKFLKVRQNSVKVSAYLVAKIGVDTALVKVSSFIPTYSRVRNCRIYTLIRFSGSRVWYCLKKNIRLLAFGLRPSHTRLLFIRSSFENHVFVYFSSSPEPSRPRFKKYSFTVIACLQSCNTRVKCT